jgi:flagellar protein FlaG
LDPVPLIAVKPGSYVPKPTLPDPVPNTDAQEVAQSAQVPTQPSASIHEHNKEVQVAAEKAMADIQKFISSMARQVRLSKDPVSGHIVVQLIDPNTGQLIRSLPSDELLRISRSFEMLGSVMVNQRA